MSLLIILLALIPLFFTVRAMLIMVGLYKSPVLSSFERYGDDETLYHPTLALIGGFMAFTLLIQLYVGVTTKSEVMIFVALMFGGLAVMLWFRYAGITRKMLDRHFIMPNWYRDLYLNTTRSERRRVAYMWLRLPRRTRAILETNTAAFMNWADLVIIGAVTDEEDL